MADKDYIFNPGNMGLVADIPLKLMTDICFIFYCSEQKINDFLAQEFSAFTGAEIKADGMFITLHFQDYKYSYPVFPNHGECKIPFTEWAFSIPVKVKLPGESQFNRYNYIPGHVLNNTLGVIPGREYFGFRKYDGIVEIPDNVWIHKSYVQSLDIPGSGQAELVNVIEIKPSSIFSLNAFIELQQEKKLSDGDFVKLVDSMLTGSQESTDVLGLLIPQFLGWRILLPFDYPASPPIQSLTGISSGIDSIIGTIIPVTYQITEMITGNINFPLYKFISPGDYSLLAFKTILNYSLDYQPTDLMTVNARS